MSSASIQKSLLPVVAIITDRIDLHRHPAYSVLGGYVRAVSEIAGAQPLLLPACADAIDADTLIDTLDGIVLTGSPSNIAAERYGATPLPATTCQDPHRDAAVFGLLPALIDAGVPILGICRGFQELNVLHGGTLERTVHAQPGRLDHREGDHDRPIQQWYDDSHDIHIVPGGWLAGIAGRSAAVNSLHHQGVERLGAGLRIEATAPDGLVEAFSLANAAQFTLAVQWHPEMRIDDCGLAKAIFSEFGRACGERRATRTRASRPTFPA